MDETFHQNDPEGTRKAVQNYNGAWSCRRSRAAQDVRSARAPQRLAARLEPNPKRKRASILHLFEPPSKFSMLLQPCNLQLLLGSTQPKLSSHLARRGALIAPCHDVASNPALHSPHAHGPNA
eukprot:scaffold16206_cov66-Phaeocystis_antarctica.AAC.1